MVPSGWRTRRTRPRVGQAGDGVSDEALGVHRSRKVEVVGGGGQTGEVVSEIADGTPVDQGVEAHCLDQPTADADGLLSAHQSLGLDQHLFPLGVWRGVPGDATPDPYSTS